MSKYFTAFLVYIAVMAILSIQAFGQFNNEKQSELSLELVETIQLGEDDYLLSNIIDVSAGPEGSILVLNDTGERVILYDEQGINQTPIGGQGRGPFELLNSTLGKLSNDKIQIWDSRQLKLSVFDWLGIGIDEYSDFRWAINDFAILDEDIYVLNSGKKSAKIFEKYNLNGDKSDPLFEAIDKTNEHQVFESIKPAVGMSVKNDKIYFMSPSSLTLYIYDPSSEEVESVVLQDSDFVVSEVKNPEAIWRSPSDLQELLRESSRVTGLFHVNDYTVITANLGKDIMNSDIQQYTSENRFNKVYLLNEDLEHVETFRYDLFDEGKLFAGTWFAANGKLGYISRQNILDAPNDLGQIYPYTVHLFDISRKSSE